CQLAIHRSKRGTGPLFRHHRDWKPVGAAAGPWGPCWRLWLGSSNAPMIRPPAVVSGSRGGPFVVSSSKVLLSIWNGHPVDGGHRREQAGALVKEKLHGAAVGLVDKLVA